MFDLLITSDLPTVTSFRAFCIFKRYKNQSTMTDGYTGKFSQTLLIFNLMGPSQNIEIFQESRLKHILRIQWLKLPTHFDLFTPSHCILLLYRLVEEFMLLANMAVAHKTHKTFPQKALLRRHPPPKSKMMEDLVNSFTIKELISSLCIPRFV